MPCCIAIIRFLQCGHSNLFKIGCTKSCENLCELSLQRALLITEYLWMCEDCSLHVWGEEDDTRADEWELRADDLKIEFPHLHRTDLLNWLVDNLHARERLEDKRLEATRLVRLEETQWVTEWTFEYAMMIFDVLHKEAYEPQKARDRIRQLLSLRLWDLVVVRDALREGKELLTHQARRSGFIISEEHGVARHIAPAGDTQELPPVPVFDEARDGGCGILKPNLGLVQESGGKNQVPGSLVETS